MFRGTRTFIEMFYTGDPVFTMDPRFFSIFRSSSVDISMKHFTAMFLGLLWITCSLVAQDTRLARLDSLFDVLSARNKAMGSIVIAHNGEIIYKRSVGYREISNSGKVLSDNDTKYRIGSISKMFTAVLIFQLVEDGKLTLETTIDRFFPKIPNAGKTTVSHLLNHRSGLYNFTDDPGYYTWMTRPHTTEEMLEIIRKGKVQFKPGRKGEYSNSNYILLGYIIEQLYGKPYREILAEKITGPLNLKDTYYGVAARADHNEARSFRYAGGWIKEPETDMSIPHGAGAIVSRPAELVQFIDGLFKGKLISRNSLEKMCTMTEGYGMGIFEIPFNSRKALGHSGAIDGFGSILAYFPADSMSFAYCSNGEAYAMNDIVIGVLSIYYGLPYTIPDFSSVAVSPDQLNQYTGVYTSKELKMDVTVTVNNNILTAQATGQSAFPLEATGPHIFRFDMAGVEMEFSPEKKEMILRQGGGTFVFKKK